ncbi:D-glucuronyl C5-epimerase family protein [Thermococcus peptonophilus]|uniref:D-glucuronyl C5-epimerase family protein n=1 Tax=Thermococcus peptonophilus TaxID=53952 RepID=UPI0006D29CEB
MRTFIAETKYGVWYLEYNYYPEQLVLNGHIITLQGLYHYWEVTGGDEKAYELFIKGGVESVKKALPDFDTGNWSRYASVYNSSSEFYHRLHIRLLLWLYAKTGDETFMEYAEKWNSYLAERGLKKENIEKLLQEMRDSP